MSYTFKQAEPIAITGTGAKKADNPFAEAVAGIAWKNDPKTGKPLALSFTEEYDAENADKIKGKIRRLMKDAGDALETPGTVRTAVIDTKNDKGIVTGGTITFWVVKLQERPRKPKPTVETAA